MASPLQDRYINLLTDVGFKQVSNTEIANFSLEERNSYENSLKYYRDLNNVVNTSRQEGVEEGFERGLERGLEQGIEQGIEQERSRQLQRQPERQRSLVFRLLERTLPTIPEVIQQQLQELSLEQWEQLNEALIDFAELSDLEQWLTEL